ncbi:MAG: nucleotide sugar dehydrogenase [Oscillospiraceae bacterium]|jgi:UDP-N-acetyl-D-mannosaminuronic acid dehydrogenase|nr:nucleotide sugar dehydrogenase [Oscillospiraceae bacterium]
MERICVLGLGYIGLPTAVTLALGGFSVCGADIRPDVVEALRDGRAPIAEPGLDAALAEALAAGRLTFAHTPPEADAFVITVQTPHLTRDDGVRAADLRFVESAARDVAARLRPGNLVVLESTVPPGTCRRLEAWLSESSGLAADEFHVAHCPERVIPGRILRELADNDRVVGARTGAAAHLACGLYRRVATGGRLRVTDDITAEMCKLVENTFRDINIAYANELSLVAEKLGIDVFRLIELANCHPRVNILSPGVGVGGHCIAVDPWFIHGLFPDDTPLIAAARRVNDQKPLLVADAVRRRLAPGARVCVLGLAYKPDVDDLRESPALTLCRALRARGVAVAACEPHAAAASVDGFDNVPLEAALSYDFLVLAVGHTLFRARRADIAARPHHDCVGLLGGTVSYK